ncbi:MAG: hypothetical protein JST12_09665 [Armatimonadetes bacterium]|nr:hypothetical protein [Armatimonadota bacterium]
MTDRFVKQLAGACLAAGIMIGCGQSPSSENLPAAPEPQVSPKTSSTNTPADQKSNPEPPKTANATSPMVNPSLRGSGIPTHAPSQPSAPPRENPAAAPPKPGEQVAKDFKIEAGDRTVEVEGVCKLTEDEAMCWKPNGDRNDDLAKELTNAIQSRSDDYSSNFQFKFMKKNRILVLKTTTAPPQPGRQGFSGSFGLMNDYQHGPGFTEGWTQNYSFFNQSSSTGFDQSRIERQVLTGAFNKDTKTFPLRYQITSYSPSNQDKASIPFQKGPFTIDGNTYEIVSISDKGDRGNPPMMRSGNQPPMKYSFIGLKVVKITNPYSVVNLMPADDSGQPYGGLDDKGNPITQAEAQKQRADDQKKMLEAQQSGKPYDYSRSMSNRYLLSLSLDPSYLSSGGANITRMMQINVEPSKIKKLVGAVNHRTIFVFDKIKLDRN